MAKKQHREPGAASTPATHALSGAGIPFTVRAYDHDPAQTDFGAEAAVALGVAAERVFKTLVADVDGEPAVAVVPVSGRLDLKALAAALGGKRAAMAAAAVAERKTGYVVGGISPVGLRSRLRTVLDESAREHETVLVSGAVADSTSSSRPRTWHGRPGRCGRRSGAVRRRARDPNPIRSVQESVLDCSLVRPVVTRLVEDNITFARVAE